jgi:hypothetical protein
MAKEVKTQINQDELFLLEQRKVKALEKLANSVDALTMWFEDIDQDDWSSRIQFYLSEFHKMVPKDKNNA